jgi:hypothetical protein
MNYYPSVETRKKHTKHMVETLCCKMNHCTNDPLLSGYVIVIFHWLLIIILLGYLIVGKVNTISYALAICLLVCLHLFYFYCNGCLLLKMERHIWNDKGWYGLPPFIDVFLKKHGIEMTNKLAINSYICFNIAFGIFIMLKIVFNI